MAYGFDISKLHKVESSNIEAIGHFGNDLYVQYKSGVVYKYLDVPYEGFLELLKSESKGRFMNILIKPNHKYERVIA